MLGKAINIENAELERRRRVIVETMRHIDILWLEYKIKQLFELHECKKYRSSLWLDEIFINITDIPDINDLDKTIEKLGSERLLAGSDEKIKKHLAILKERLNRLKEYIKLKQEAVSKELSGKQVCEEMMKILSRNR